MSLTDLMLSRRQAIGFAGATLAALGLAACDDAAPAADDPTAQPAEEAQLDAEAYDALIAEGAVASDDVVAASEWASKVRDAGTLRVGGVQTSMLFSLLNEKDGVTRGFDAGLSQLLTRYVLGDEAAQEITQVTSNTRESVLQNDQVDVVFATYSITDARKELISFAGPYYSTQQSILVMAENEDIDGLDDLAGALDPFRIVMVEMPVRAEHDVRPHARHGIADPVKRVDEYARTVRRREADAGMPEIFDLHSLPPSPDGHGRAEKCSRWRCSPPEKSRIYVQSKERRPPSRPHCRLSTRASAPISPYGVRMDTSVSARGSRTSS